MAFQPPAVDEIDETQPKFTPPAPDDVDVASNHDKYYKMQLIDCGDDKYVYFARYGRTGTKGATDFKGPFDFETGLRSFSDLFKVKTGNDWDDRFAFAVKKNKYDLLVVIKRAARALMGSWEYYVEDNVQGKPNAWYPYTSEGEKDSEALYDTYSSNPSYSQRIVDSGSYAYLVNLVDMTQTNASTGKQVHPHVLYCRVINNILADSFLFYFQVYLPLSLSLSQSNIKFKK